jgi:hypothetical protein
MKTRRVSSIENGQKIKKLRIIPIQYQTVSHFDISPSIALSQQSFSNAEFG